MTRRETWRERAIDSFKESICYAAIYLVALYGSRPILKSSSLIPPGFDSPMHFSKVRIFSQSFPNLPRWFPWWYCGTPSLRFYPPLSYFFTNFIGWLLQLSPLEAYTFTDLFTFYITGLSLYVLMRRIGLTRPSSVASAALYMLSPQTLYGRFFIGHFTHNFSVFLVPLTFYCIITYGRDLKKTILATAPIFALTFLSHLQTALSLGFMVAIYIFLTIIIRKRRDLLRHLQGILIGGLIGALLAGFWLVPSILEGMGRLSLTREAALQVMIPIESLFVPADQIWYLPPLQKIWCKQYFLGIPMIALSLISIMLIVKGEIPPEKRLWWSISASWVLFLLLAIVSPHVGLVLGWPNRLPYFVSMPMAMLAGFAIEWMEKFRLSKFISNIRIKRINSYIVVTTILLLSAIPVLNIESFIYYPYSNEVEVSRFIEKMGRNQMERVAFFGTLSYVFNAISNRWQLDGGYVQGQINIDFYYKYWRTLTKSNDLNSILNMLNKTNTRYIIFPKGQTFPSIYEDKRFFDEIETDGFIIFKLKDNYTLNFITLLEGKALLSYSYPNPDQICIKAWRCSKNITIIVKMNYYPGWTADSTQGEVKLTRDPDGLMKIQLLNADDATDIILQYGLTATDYIGLGATITGALLYILIFLSVTWKYYEGWTHTLHKRAYIGQIRKKKESTAKVSREVTEKIKKVMEMGLEREKSAQISVAQASQGARWLSRLYHLISVMIVATYALYISQPYLKEHGLPAFVDAPGHAFKVWYLIDCWEKYRVIPYFWDSWWYAGYPFLQVYPPLSYMLAAFFGRAFFNGDPILGFRYTIALSNVVAAICTYIGIYMLFGSKVGGVIGGIVYASSAHRAMAVRTGMFPVYVATMFLPLIIPLYQRCLSSSAPRRYMLSASVLALLLLTHIQVFVYALFTLALYLVLTLHKLHHKGIAGFFSFFLKNIGVFALIISIALCFTSFWLIPFLSYRSFFYTAYPEYYLKIQSIPGPHHFFQKTGKAVYIGLSSLGLIILAFIVNKRARIDHHMIFFSILGFLSAFLSIYQHETFKGTVIEQMPYYHMITPERWVFITFLSIAFLAGGAVKFIFDLINQHTSFIQRSALERILKVCLILIVICVIFLDVTLFARNIGSMVPSILSFPSVIKDVSYGDEYYRIMPNMFGLAYVPAVTYREITAGWYIEGSVLRDWLYNLDWVTSYGRRENLIAPILQLFATKYFVTGSDDVNRIVRFNRTGEFNIYKKGGYCVMELKRDVQYFNARIPILYLGKREDLMNIAETLLFSSDSSILINGWKEHVDDYTIDELSKFDAVLISRYDCVNGSRMNDLLIKYAEHGGTVFVAPFYSTPILGMQLYYAESKGNYTIRVNEKFRNMIFRDVDFSNFSPAIYGGKYSWSYVAFKPSSTKYKTETLLTIDGNPVLAVSTLGKGKIVWIGFNFLLHINHFLNRDEGRMMSNLIDWACGKPPNVKVVSFEKRPYGYVDAVIKVNSNELFWLLISETYYPGWKVYINGKPAEVYMAEPKLMMVKIGETHSNNIHISLRYEMTEIHMVGFAISVLSIAFMAALLIREQLKISHTRKIVSNIQRV